MASWFLPQRLSESLSEKGLSPYDIYFLSLGVNDTWVCLTMTKVFFDVGSSYPDLSKIAPRQDDRREWGQLVSYNKCIPNVDLW